MMNSNSYSFPPARVTPNALHAFGGVWRLTVRRLRTLPHWALLATMSVVLVVCSIPATLNHDVAMRSFLPWASRFYICFVLPLLAFISAGSVMRDDLQADTVDYVFTRPVRRSAYVLFRYLSHVVCTQIDFSVSFAAVIGIGVYHGVPGLWAAAPWLLLAQVIVITAFSGFGFLCGLLTSRYVIVGLLYGAVIEVGVGSVPTQLSRMSMTRQVIGMLRDVVGDVDSSAVMAVEAGSLGAVATVALLLSFAIFTLAATVLIFRRREFAGSAAREG